jgi:autotransporter-associated beta strand protein
MGSTRKLSGFAAGVFHKQKQAQKRNIPSDWRLRRSAQSISRAVQYALEPMEPRLLLSVFTWANASGHTSWSDGSAWVGGTAPGSGDTAVFAASSSVVLPTLTAAASVAGITIDDSQGAYSIGESGNQTLTIGSLGLTVSAPSASSSVTSTVTANLSLSGTETLTVANSTVSAATTSLQLSGSIGDSGFLETAGAGSIDFSGSLTFGSWEGFYVDGSGSVLISSPNNTMATAAVAGGTLTVAAANAAGSGQIADLSGGTIDITVAGGISGELFLAGGALNESVANGITGNQGINCEAGAVTLDHANNFSGNATILGGVLNVAAAGALGSSTIVGDAGTLSLQTANAVSAGGIFVGGMTVAESASDAISGNCSVTVSIGTLSLNQTNNYSGGTFVEGGTLSVAAANALGTGTVALESGSLNLTAAAAIDGQPLNITGGTLTETAANAITGSLALSLTGGTTSLSQSNNFSGSSTLAGVLNITAAGALGASLVDLSGGTLSLQVSDALNANSLKIVGGTLSESDSDAIGGNSSLTMDSGTLTLTQANNYSGGTIVDGGVVKASVASSLGTDLVTLTSGTLSLQASDAINGQTLTVGGGTLTETASNAITGSVTLNVTGGTVTLSQSNNFSGSSTLAGVVDASAATAFGTSLVYLYGGTLSLQAGSAVDGNALIFAGGSLVETASDAISGSTSLTVSSGTVTFTEPNSFTGVTTVNAGATLLAENSSGSATGTGSVTIMGNATLGGNGSISGTVSVASSGTVRPGVPASGSQSPGALTFGGSLTLGSGALYIPDLEGTTAGTGYSQIVVNGSATVSGAKLEPRDEYAQQGGDALAIVSEGSGASVTGSFVNSSGTTLTSGSTLSIGGQPFYVTYPGTSGQGALLTAQTSLPALSSANIGSPTLTGSSSILDGTYTIAGAGSGISGTSDQFHFDSENVGTQTTVNAEVSSITNTNAAADAGLMIRGNTSASSAYVGVFATESDGVIFQWRSTSGGNTSSTQVTGISAPSSADPVWLELIRNGSTFSAYYSTDGSTYTQIGSSETVSLANEAIGGLAVSSNNASSLNTAVFSNVSVDRVSTVSAEGLSIDAAQGESFSATLATFSDTLSGTTAGEYSATIDWGDGTTPTTGDVVADGSGFDVEGTHTYATGGYFTPVVSIVDTVGLTVQAAGEATVAGLSGYGGALQATPGQRIEVADFIDTAADASTQTYTASIAWGNGNTTTGAVASDGDGGFEVIGNNTYGAVGTYAPTLTITATDSRTLTLNGTVAVSTIVADGQTLNSVQGQSASGIVALFTDTTPGTSPSTYTASIDWGDGNTTTGTVASVGDGVFSVSGNDTYPSSGSFNPIVTISSVAGGATTATATANVSGLSVTEEDIDAVQGASFSGLVADFSDDAPDAASQTYSASINWGDGNTSSGNLTSDGDGGFDVNATHTYVAAGLFNAVVTITAEDGRTGNTSDYANVTSLTADGESIDAQQGSSFSGSVATFTDADSGTTAADYTASIDWGDGNVTAGTVTASGSGFEVTGANTYAAAGSYDPTVTITDPSGASVAVSGAATVAGLSVTGQDIDANQGQSYSGVLATFTDNASDASSEMYTATIDWGDGGNSTGTVASNDGDGYTVTGTHTYSSAGSQSPTILITATDGRTASASASATIGGISVTEQDFRATAGASFTGTVATFDDSNYDAPAETYTASIAWGDGNTSSGNVTSDGSGGWIVAGTHTYSSAGNFAPVVTVTALDDRTGNVTDAANVTSLTASGSSFSANQGEAYTGTIATFTDANSGTSATDYSASIDWGDGNTSEGAVVSDGSGGFDVIGTNSFTVAGALSPAVTIVDPSGASVTATAAATVSGLTATGGRITPTQGSTFSGVVGTFTDTEPGSSGDTYTASINWNDGTITTATVASNGSGGYNVSGNHTYSSVGDLTPTITILSSDGRTASVQATATVSGLTVTEQDFSATQGEGFDGTVATFTDNASDASSQTYTASIDWGDGGNSTTGTVTSDGDGGWIITGNYTYSAAGNYTATVTITASDSRTNSVSDSADVTSLTATGETISATQGTSFSGVVADFTDANSGTSAGDYSATIDWGDGNTSTGTIASDGAGGFTVTGNNTYASAGTFNPTVTIIDPSGATSTASATANVSGLITTTQNFNAAPGAAFTGAVATFSDSASDASGQTYTASINWGDGSTPATGNVTSNGSGGFTVTGNKTYVSDGPFDVAVTIVASDGRTTSMTETAFISTMTAVGQSISATMGGSFTGIVATFTDSTSGTTASDYGATINWGDGNTSAGTIASDGDGGFTVTGTNTFAASGDLNPTVTISKGDPGQTQTQANASVSELAQPELSVVDSALSGDTAEADIAWSDPDTDGHTAVEIEEKDPDGNFYLIDTISTPSSSPGSDDIDVSGLMVNATTEFRARAIAQGLSSLYSPSVNVDVTNSSGTQLFADPTDDITVTDAQIDPSTNTTTLTVTTTNTNITNPDYLDSFSLLGYSADDPYQIGVYYTSTLAGTLAEGTAANTYTITFDGYYSTGFAPGKQYFLQLTWNNTLISTYATTQHYSSVFNAETEGTPDSGPTNFAVASNGNGTYTASWSYTDSGTSQGDGFNIYELQPGEQPSEVGSTTSASSTSVVFDAAGTVTDMTDFFAVAVLSNGVAPYNPIGYSTYSNFAEANVSPSAPTAPGNLTAVATTLNGQQGISLEWDNDSNNETGFTVERSTSSNFSTDVTSFNVPADTTTYVDSTAGGNNAIKPMITYYYKVGSTNESVTSPVYSSQTASATLPCLKCLHTKQLLQQIENSIGTINSADNILAGDAVDAATELKQRNYIITDSAAAAAAAGSASLALESASASILDYIFGSPYSVDVKISIATSAIGAVTSIILAHMPVGAPAQLVDEMQFDLQHLQGNTNQLLNYAQQVLLILSMPPCGCDLSQYKNLPLLLLQSQKIQMGSYNAIINFSE